MDVTFCILDADYVIEDGRPVIRLWGKTSEGQSIVVLDRNFQPYFYLETEEEGIASKIRDLEFEGSKVEKVESVERKLYGEKKKFLRVFVDMPASVPKFRELLKDWEGVKQCYEYAVSFYKRYLIDKGLVPLGWVKAEGREVKPDIKVDIVLDAKEIETLKKENYPDLVVLAFDIEMIQEEGKENIIMISIADNTGFKRVLTYGVGSDAEYLEVLENEKEMIKRFIEVVQAQNPDIITGYNTDNFDFMKISDKCREYGIAFSLGRTKVVETKQKKRGKVQRFYITGRVNVDLYVFIETILGASLGTDILTLDRVSRELIGKGKKEVKWKDIEQAWKNREIGLIADYCLQDSELALGLALEILPQIFELCRVTGQTLFDASRMSYSQLVEWLLIRKAYEVGEIIPNRPKYDEIMRRRAAPAYIGGYVHPPKEGIHKNIALFDFTSLYPSIIITHNVSPESLDCSCCKEDVPSAQAEFPVCTVGPGHKVPNQDHYYCSKNKGFVSAVLEEIVNKRYELNRELKDMQKNSLRHKSLYNRQYALKILANASYGYYGYAGSRWYSRICAESITSWGRFYIKNIIQLAQDLGLDVIYGDTDSLFLKIITELEARDFLQKANGSLPGIMELDFKDLYKSGIFVLTKTGLAAKKRYALLDYNDNIIIRGFERVRRDWAPVAKYTQESVLLAVLKDNSPEKAIEAVQSQIEKIKSGSVSLDDLVIYSQITRPLSKYEQIGPHVAAAKKMVERGKIIKEGHTIGYIVTKGVGSISQRAEPAEDATNYDPDYYINNQVIPAALRVLGSLGYTEQEILGEQKQASLKGFLET